MCSPSLFIETIAPSTLLAFRFVRETNTYLFKVFSLTLSSKHVNSNEKTRRLIVKGLSAVMWQLYIKTVL